MTLHQGLNTSRKRKREARRHDSGEESSDEGVSIASGGGEPLTTTDLRAVPSPERQASDSARVFRFVSASTIRADARAKAAAVLDARQSLTATTAGGWSDCDAPKGHFLFTFPRYFVTASVKGTGEQPSSAQRARRAKRKRVAPLPFAPIPIDGSRTVMDTFMVRVEGLPACMACLPCR